MAAVLCRELCPDKHQWCSSLSCGICTVIYNPERPFRGAWGEFRSGTNRNCLGSEDVKPPYEVQTQNAQIQKSRDAAWPMIVLLTHVTVSELFTA